MPVPLLAEAVGRGPEILSLPYVWTLIKLIPVVAVVYIVKQYFQGAKCRSERNMHGKVVMVTGGTSGVGADIVRELAKRGAQIVLLSHHAPDDFFLVNYIEDLRASCNNEMIYAEHVDLSSLHSIRTFATKWVDNVPPRRLDSIVLCAGTQTPRWGTAKTTTDGVEEEWMVNYLSTFHLLGILSPAIRAQPPDRDVRIIFSTCNSYIGATLDLTDLESKTKAGSISNARSKLATMSFAMTFQKHLDAYNRPDKHINNARVLVVDPGLCRTPGMRRWLTGGSLFGLFCYLLTWPIWWLVLKSPVQGAQTHLYAAMEAGYGHGAGGKFLKECREIEPLRPEIHDEKIAKTLWEFSDKQIERLEKQGAVKRALEKKEREASEKKAAKYKPIATMGLDGNASNNSARSTTTATQQAATPGSRKNKRTA